jgi:hypothetical protein
MKWDVTTLVTCTILAIFCSAVCFELGVGYIGFAALATAVIFIISAFLVYLAPPDVG